MQAVSTTPFNISMQRKANTWYTACDGNWSDPKTWISNGKRKHNLPQEHDTAYINHTVTLDLSLNITRLYGSGSLIFGSAANHNIGILDTLNFTGTIDMSSAAHNLYLVGSNNYVPYDNFNAGSYSAVIYDGVFNQSILNIRYNNLITQNIGKKYQVSDIIIGGSFNQQSDYECGNFNLTVNGSSIIGTVGSFIFSKNGPGNILFIGFVDFEGGTDLSGGNPNVEFRDGLTIHTFLFISGSGIVTFSTNDQTFNIGAYLGGSWASPIIIQGPVTLTLTGTEFYTQSSINGTSSSSTLNNNGTLYLVNNSTPMTTGVFNYQNSTDSTLGYLFDGDFIIPYSTYANLSVGGTGVKTLGADTTINNNLTNSGNFDFGGYDLLCLGSFTHTADGSLTASSFCNVTIGGMASFGAGVAGCDLTTGNPNIEFKGGLAIHSQFLRTGTGIFKFSTNNQTIDFSAYIIGQFACNVLIGGAITVTFNPGGVAIQRLLGTLNGDNPASTFNNLGYFAYSNSQQPMQTGLLLCNSVGNTFEYDLDGDQDITPISYTNLTLSNGGNKRLLGNVSVGDIYTLSSPATLDSNGFTLTNP